MGSLEPEQEADSKMKSFRQKAVFNNETRFQREVDEGTVMGRPGIC
jgi:hypothetical protein